MKTYNEKILACRNRKLVPLPGSPLIKTILLSCCLSCKY